MVGVMETAVSVMEAAVGGPFGGIVRSAGSVKGDSMVAMCNSMDVEGESTVVVAQRTSETLFTEVTDG